VNDFFKKCPHILSKKLMFTFYSRFCVDNPLDNEQKDKGTLFRSFHSQLMSGVRQGKSETEDTGKDMQILGNNDCRSAGDKMFVHCVSPLKFNSEKDDKYHKDDSWTYDSDFFESEISVRDNQISMEDRIGENQLVLQYNCNLCKYQTTKKKNLVGHQKSNHEGIKYKCNQCEYQATHKIALIMHQKSKHEGIRYKCNQCDYQATQKSSLIRHQKSKHEGIRYKCNQCDYQATLKGNLITHQKSKHEGKRYECTQCDYQATLKSNLITHQKSKHEGKI
jgi:predicted RNA-binding Zn-ribbon protein involved in translation (DUF1610 family)